MGVVLYNPERICIEKIIQYNKVFDNVLVYDNSTNDIDYRDELIEVGCYYYSNNGNDGICVAINSFIKYCWEQKIDYLCTMDQDSDFNDSEIIKVLNYIEKSDMYSIGIVAPRIIYKGIDNKAKEPNEIVDVDWVITSGSFINIRNIVDNNVWYDEKYFIDRCDIDFCMQVASKGLRIIKYTKAKLFQELGVVNEKNYSEHSAIRHYYMSRNRLYFNRKYYKKFKAILLSIAQTFKHIYFVISFEHEKKDKMIAILQGVLDYQKRKLGKRI